MTIGDDILLECNSSTVIPLGIPTDLVDNFTSTTDFFEKQKCALSIIEFLHTKYFVKFNSLDGLFKALISFETEFLYKYLYYRDHFLHSFQVFLLGCYIVKKSIENDFPIEFLSGRNIESFIRVWFLIAIYHDIGYTVQDLLEIGKKIKDIYFNHISGSSMTNLNIEFSERIDGIFKEILETISYGILYGEEKYLDDIFAPNNEFNNKILLNELIEYYQKRNHGIISSLFLFYSFNLDITLLKPILIDEYSKEIKIACAAISTHDIERYKKIHLNLNENPYGCLLILCDNLQDWNRPRNLKQKEENFKKFQIEIDHNEKSFIFILDVIDSAPLEEISEKKFSELKRIFNYSITRGLDFEFSIKNSTAKKVMRVIFNEDQGKYNFTSV